MTGLENTTLYNEDMKGIAISSASFELFIREDVLYVDKTSYIYKIVKNPARNFHFVSRPRRFGKSLFCNTLESLFKGDKELFKGLYIYDKYDFKPYPVLHFDFSGMTMLTLDGFLSSFRNQIRLAVKQFGITVNDTDDPVTAFENAINEIHEKYGEIVIIIDEYDDPLITATLRNKPFLDDIREAFNSFYKTIKKNAGKVRFFFMTGVVKLSNLSIFSAMNNLVDLSMDKEFAGAFGYTDEELDEYFGEGIDEYLEANPGVYESREEFRERIRDYYDGYGFSPESETRVYNPVSIGYFFFNKNCNFDNYWIRTASSALAITLARNIDLSRFMTGNDLEATSTDFAIFDISVITDRNADEGQILALLYYTGYLTIRKPSFRGYTLCFPNEEVAVSFSSGLIGMYLGSNTVWRSLAENVYNACNEGDTEKLVEAIDKYFNALPYSIYGGKTYESTFQGLLLGLFISTGMMQNGEEETTDGRMDAVAYSKTDIWIFELKVDKSAEEALEQINTKGYADKFGYLIDGRKVHKVGLNFSSETRRLESWKSE